MSAIAFGPVYTMTPGYPGMYRQPRPAGAPRVPAYFPKMKVRGRRRRAKWDWAANPVITMYLREAMKTVKS